MCTELYRLEYVTGSKQSNGMKQHSAKSCYIALNRPILWRYFEFYPVITHDIMLHSDIFRYTVFVGVFIYTHINIYIYIFIFGGGTLVY